MNSQASHIYRPGEGLSGKRQRLKEIITAKTFREGAPMTLASGKVSGFYFNTKPTMLDPEGASLIGALILDALAGVEADFIGGLEMGAVPIASLVAPASFYEGRPLRGLIIRKKAKEHGTQSLIEGLSPEESLKGLRVIVVEDVTTTGGSALKAIEVLQGAHCEVVHVLTLIDREEGAAEQFQKKRLPFIALFGAREFISIK